MPTSSHPDILAEMSCLVFGSRLGKLGMGEGGQQLGEEPSVLMAQGLRGDQFSGLKLGMETLEPLGSLWPLGFSPGPSLSFS